METLPAPTGRFLPSFSFLLLLVLCLFLLPARAEAAEPFRIGIMQAQKGSAGQYASLQAYLHASGSDAQFVEMADYATAARLFAHGELDGMFSGSGIAAAMLIKGIAYPLLRPVSAAGHSTYWAAIIGREGSPRFNHDGSYFRGQRVTYCALASSGEFYFRSLPDAVKSAAEIILASSHSEALRKLAAGEADFAIVKNRVWENLRGSYPELEQVGNDPGQNPDNTLIIWHKADRKVVEKVAGTLLALQKDNSAAATAVRNELRISGYVATSSADFKHTLQILDAAGVDAGFDFRF